MTEISTVQTEVTPLDVEVTASNSTEIATAEDGLDVTITKKEYKIVGDEVYIAKLYDDAPQWMKDLVQLVVDNTVEQTNIELLNSVVEQLNQFATSYVPLNMYTQQVLDLSNADASMHALIETINSNFNNGLDEANAQIIGLENTKASKDEVIAQVLTTISSELATPTSDLGATIANLQQSIVTGDTANANSIQALTSSLEGEVDARAAAISTLDTRVTATETAVTAQASDITALTTEVNNGTSTWAAADSNLENSLTTAITNGLTTAESKFAYNSNLNINGTSYSSGFGLATSLVDASIPVGSSEFWVKSDKFRLVAANSDIKSAYSPFSVDATTGNILMNGNVRFLNTTGGTGTLQDVVQGYVETVQVGDKNINITDNLIPMVSLIADTNNAGYQFIGTPTKSNAIGISAYAEPQIQMDAGDEVYSPYVTELALAYYYRFGITGVTSLSGVKLVTIDAANTVTYTTLVVTLDPGQSLQSNQWYVVEGLTNPTGSSGGSDGSIRTANGTKIGTVNVYVLPTGATKLLLGWVGPCTISRGKLAKVSADTVTGDVASIDYVDTAITNAPYVLPAEVADAINNNTTTIDGSKITTGSIAADKINTTDLIAKNIMSSSTIYGNKIEGSLIKGAKIEGAVIKASYIDLDGDLEVLTDYHITEAMYASAPSLYTDAVRLSGEYRLPTLSSITTEVIPYQVSIANTTNYSTYLAGMPLLRNNEYTTNIFAYNQGAVGSNRKYRRAQPYVTVSQTELYASPRHVVYINSSGDRSDDAAGGAYHDVYVYFGTTLLLHVYGGVAGTGAVGTLSITQIPAVYANGVEVIPANTWGSNTSVVISSNGFTFTVYSASSTVYYSPVSVVTITLEATATNMLVPFNVLAPFRVVIGNNTFVSGYTVKTPQIIVNNLL